jgi:hypothetical protein
VNVPHVFGKYFRNWLAWEGYRKLFGWKQRNPSLEMVWVDGESQTLALHLAIPNTRHNFRLFF